MSAKLKLPVHCDVPFSTVDQNCLVVGGRKLDELAEEVGKTPFYAYDASIIESRISELKASLPDSLHLHYAIKANPMPEVVNLISPLVDGLDVASVAEMRVALGSGTSPHLISFAGPGKTVEELREAVQENITINVESETELQRIRDIGRNAGKAPRIAIRVNPDFELKSSGMKMAGGPKPFGIDAERVPAILESLNPQELTLIGFHIFSGSQNLKPEAIEDAQKKSVELAASLSKSAPGPLEFVNIGGGFGIPYFPGDQKLDLSLLGKSMTAVVDRAATVLPGATIVIELGRYIVGESGVYVCRVLDKKESRGHTYLITDGGLHHHLAASGNFGQVIRKNYPVLIGNKITGKQMETVSIVGPLCTPLDILADRMELPAAEIGDLAVVFQSGAYGLSASPLGFLSHPSPAEILV